MKKKLKKSTSLDDLAIMVANGFSDIDGKFSKRFDGMDKRMDGIDKPMKGLEDGQKQIKLRLDNVAYRFELVELQRRVNL